MTAERLCPECLGALEAREDGSARCTVHGGEYKILFWREGQPAPPVIPAAAPNSAQCANHPNLPAIFLCRRCGAAICELCGFPQTDGSRLCPACATVHSAAPAFRSGVSAVALAVQNRNCPQHPNVAAVQICQICGAPMCATCDFLLPGNFHVCPKCATTPQTSLSPKRKRLLIGSFAMAGWCTLVMAALLSGAFRNMVTDKASEEAFGLLISFILFIPSIIGTALGVSSMDRRLSNTMAMWIATIWNGLILGGFILLMIIGIMKGG